MEILGRLIGAVGVCVFLGIAFLLSNNRKKIKWKIVLICIVGEFLTLLLVLHTAAGKAIVTFIADSVIAVVNYSFYGITFIFGDLYTKFSHSYPFLFTGALPLIFIGSLIGLLYYITVMQRVVWVLSFIFSKIMKLSGAESTATVSNIFLGPNQSTLAIKPYLKNLTQSELFLVMVSGMATVTGSMLYPYHALGGDLNFILTASVMSAPGAIIVSKIMYPELSDPETFKTTNIKAEAPESENMLQAISDGAFEGSKIFVAMTVLLLAFVSLIYLLNGLTDLITFHHVNFNDILGWLFLPVAFIIGVPFHDLHAFSVLLAQKTFFNEVVAYAHIKSFTYTPKTFMMLCFALTGFANISAIPMLIGGIGALVPSRRDEVTALGLKALVAAVLTNILSATIAGIMYF